MSNDQLQSIMALASDIKAAIDELSDGSAYPDLMSAVDKLAESAIRAIRAARAAQQATERQT